MSSIIAVHHCQVSIPKGSENQAIEFYCGLLGLKQIKKPDSLKARGGFWVELGSMQIHFGAEDGVDRPKTKAHVAYQVTQLEHWRKRLQETGISVTDGIPIPGMNRVEFRDPFGNRIEMLEIFER